MLKLSPTPLADLMASVHDHLTRELIKLGAGDAPSYEIRGSGQVLIDLLASAEEAASGALCFAVKPEFLEKAIAAKAAAVIVTPSLAENSTLPSVITAEPRLFFAVLLGLVKTQSPKWSTTEPFFKDITSVQLGDNVTFAPFTYIGAGVKIGRGTTIGPQVFIEDGVEIGEDCLIHPRVTLRWGTKIGHRCQIHTGSVLGEDGFGYNQVASPTTGRLIHFKNPHLGGVSISDDVEIGAMAAIDRGLITDTVVEKGTKIDNLVQIGHNCHIGKDCIIVSQVGAAGHSQVGDRVFLLGQAGLSHGSEIGADAVIGGQSGVLGRIPPGRRVWSGCPAKPQEDDYRTQIMIQRDLPKWRRFLQLFKKASSFDDLKSSFTTEDSKKNS